MPKLVTSNTVSLLMTPGFPIIEYVPPGGLPPDTDVLVPAHMDTELQWLLRVTLGGELTLT